MFIINCSECNFWVHWYNINEIWSKLYTYKNLKQITYFITVKMNYPTWTFNLTNWFLLEFVKCSLHDRITVSQNHDPIVNEPQMTLLILMLL